MTTTISEFEYGNNLETRRPQTRKKHQVSLAAVIVGLLVLAMAGTQAWFGIHWLHHYMIRLNSLAAFNAILMPPPQRDPLLRQLGVSEATVFGWAIFAYAMAALLGLTGLWVVIRRRFGWRMLWVGAIGTILAAAVTVVGGYVLEHYAGFPSQAKRIYVIAFLIHSAPGWAILTWWLIQRQFVRQPGPSDTSPDGSKA